VQVGIVINQGVSMSKNALLVAILVIASVAAIAIGVLQLAPAAVTPAPAAPAAGGNQQTAPGPTPAIADVRRIGVGDLHGKLQGSNPPLVWDLRSAEAYAQQHIPRARLVQISEIPTLVQGLDRKQAIVTLCA
jgi:hypothetical protein